MSAASNNRIAELIKRLDQGEVGERKQAFTELVQLGSTAIPALLEALNSPRQHLRWETAKVLGKIADPSSAEQLVAALGDKDADVRWVVGEALIVLRRHALKPLLMQLTQTDLPDGMPQGAHHVLHDLAKHDDFSEMLKPVLAAFKEHEPGVAVPVAAAEALKKL